MSAHDTHMPLDAQGIPILTDLVDQATDSAVDALAARQDPREIAQQAMQSEVFQQLLGTLSDDIALAIGLQLEQVLTTAIDDAVNKALAGSDTRTRDLINRKLESALPELLTKALQDS